MPLALVTGAAGAMGSRLVSRLLQQGWQVRALVLPKDPLRARIEASGAEIREGNVSDAASLSHLCDGVDTVYHLAAVIIADDTSVFQRVNRDGTAGLAAEAARAGVRHFIYVSSASVVYPRRTPYGESKLQAEEIVRAAGVPFTIVRPTLVYEPGGGQELMMYLAQLRRFPIAFSIGAGNALKRPVWAEDVVDGLLRLAGNSVAFGKTYNFSGAEAITMLELTKLLLEHHAAQRPIVRVPVLLCSALAWALRPLMRRPPLTASAIAGVVYDADLDPAAAIADLGYRPLGVRQGFMRCFSDESKWRQAEQEALSSEQLQKGSRQ